MRSKVILVLAALVLTACGSNSGGRTNQVSQTLTGSGSTFVQNYLQACATDFTKATNINVSYAGGGSGKGRTDIANKTVDFAMSDTPFTDAPSGLIHVPIVAGPIAIMYKLDGFSGQLKLKKDVLAKIFAAKITKWNDPAITADNPGLPNLPISVHYRQDSSGTSGVFTGYLNAVAPNIWNKGSNSDFKSAFPGSIPTNGSFQAASGSDGVSQGVNQKNGAITYAELSYANERDLKTAAIENESGSFIAPSPQAAAKFLANATPDAAGIITPDYANADPGSYNLTAFTYGLALPGATKAKEVAKLFTSLLTNCSGQAERLDYAPLQGSVLERAKDLVGRL